MFYISDDDFEKVKNIQPIGIIARQKKDEKETTFLSRLRQYNDNSLVQDIFLELDMNKEIYATTFNSWKIIFPEDKLFKFRNKNIYYPKVCSSERTVKDAIEKGYINILLDQNLLPQITPILEKVPKEINFSSTANDGTNNNFWIRPEGIEQYNSVIKNWFLISTPDMSDTIRYYQSKNSIGSKTMIHGLEIEEQSGISLLPQEFDKLRFSCNKHCLTCELCERTLHSFNKIASESFKKEKVGN